MCVVIGIILYKNCNAYHQQHKFSFKLLWWHLDFTVCVLHPLVISHHIQVFLALNKKDRGVPHTKISFSIHCCFNVNSVYMYILYTKSKMQKFIVNAMRYNIKTPCRVLGKMLKVLYTFWMIII